MKELNGRYTFKFKVNKKGNLGKLLEIESQKGLKISEDAFNKDAINYVKLRIDKFKEVQEGGLNWRNFKKIKEYGVTGKRVMLIYKITSDGF